MANGTDQDTPDIPELLRRRGILAGMDIAQQEPTTTTGVPWSQIPGSATYQPPTDFTKVAGSTTFQPQPTDQPQVQPTPLGAYTPQMMAPPQMNTQPPSAAPFEAAATNLQNIGAAPMSRDYPRNKLLTALVAPLMLKQFIRNPQQASENLDFLTRKGYGAAEQRYGQQLAQATQSYKIQSEVLNERLKIFSDNLSASKTMADTQMSVGKYNAWVAQLPLEQQEQAARLAESQARAIKLKSPDIDTAHMLTVTYKDANGVTRTTNAYPRLFPDGRPPEYIDLTTGKPITDRINVSPAPTAAARLNMREQLFADGIKQFQDRNGGKSPEGRDLDNVVKHVEDTIAAPAAERAAMVANRENFNRIAKEFDTKANNIGKPIDLELGSIRGLKTSLSKADANGVAAQLAIVETATAMAGGLRPVSRYNLGEINNILTASGGIEGIRTKIDHWLTTGGLASGVPQETLKQIGQLADVMQRELIQQQKTINKYRTELNRAAKNDDINKIADINERLDNELNAGPPMSLEDAAKARGIIK